MIKNILFDMGGVIFRQNTPEAFSRFQALGIDTNRYMGHYGQKEFFLQVEEGKIDQNEFCSALAHAAGKESISYEQALECWLGYITDVPVERLRDLETLREKYVLGLLSNTNPFIMDYMDTPKISSEGKPISDYFDHLFLSYELGVCKPSAEIYTKSLQQGNMVPEETIFVDDSLKNIEAAMDIGMHGLHVTTNQPWYDLLTAEINRINAK